MVGVSFSALSKAAAPRRCGAPEFTLYLTGTKFRATRGHRTGQCSSKLRMTDSSAAEGVNGEGLGIQAERIASKEGWMAHKTGNRPVLFLPWRHPHLKYGRQAFGLGFSFPPGHVPPQ